MQYSFHRSRRGDRSESSRLALDWTGLEENLIPLAKVRLRCWCELSWVHLVEWAFLRSIRRCCLPQASISGWLESSLRMAIRLS